MPTLETGAGYRQSALTCPHCDELLAERRHGDAYVDLCPQCQGLWVDWMDGNLTQVARAVGELPEGRSAGDAPGACPRCRVSLASASVGGAAVLRCGGCAGVFVPREALAILAGGAKESEAPTDPFLTRLLDRIAGWLVP